MNPVKHANISVKKRGGHIDDYLPIHSFMDSTKELCSDNRHRILHTHWGISRVIIPIFGHTITNSEGRAINVKDICEQDHILPDYGNRFIPTLADFVREIEMDKINAQDIIEFSQPYRKQKELMNLLLSPLHVTGVKVSLLITHNSWFMNEIIPKIMDKEAEIRDFKLSPSILFNNMRFQLWMDNGKGLPKSARLSAGKIIS